MSSRAPRNAIILSARTGTPPRWRSSILSPDASIKEVGAKAKGLALLPPNWRPFTVVVSHSVLRELVGAEPDPAALESVARRVLRHFPTARTLIVRSSAEREDIGRRGHFSSRSTEATPSELARCMNDVFRASTPRLHTSEEGFAVVVQELLSVDAKGHLTNEYRHAQRSVDYLFEADEVAQPSNCKTLRAAVTRSFRLNRPVLPPSTSQHLRYGTLDSDLAPLLQTVGRWLASQKNRAHCEWVASGGRFWIVQYDIEQDIPDREPLSLWRDLRSRRTYPALTAFHAIDNTGRFDRWRKTRSHRVLSEVGLYVPPIFVLDDPTLMRQLQDGAVSPLISADLEALSGGGLVLRLDVDSSVKDWTNLPAAGPLTSASEAANVILRAAADAAAREISPDNLAFVAHHFIRAPASAWAQASPTSDEVKIDATWGLPDGLQAFPYDTHFVNVSGRQVFVQKRYKDEYLDMDATGRWVATATSQSRAKQRCVTDEHALAIADATLRVARHRGAPTVVMWFVGVSIESERETTVLPWILADAEDSFSEAITTAPKRRVEIQRRLRLGGTRRIRDEHDLSEFLRDPKRYDLGHQHVLLRPTGDLLRRRDFLESVAEAVKSLGGWYLVLEGSLLAHATYQLRKYGVPVVSIWDYVRAPRATRHGKLVRDAIPDRIRAAGDEAVTVPLHGPDFERALREKLVEESLEVLRAADAPHTVEELADVLAVMSALATATGVTWDDITEAEKRKRQQRGGFEKAIYLSRTRPFYLKDDGYQPRRALFREAIRRLRYRPGVAVSLVPPPSEEPVTLRVALTDDQSVELSVTYVKDEVVVSLAAAPAEDSTDGKQLTLWKPTSS